MACRHWMPPPPVASPTRRLRAMMHLSPSVHLIPQTTYHSRTPQVCDEIKVQLPENLTPRHRLVFTVFHVHVKRKTGGMFAKSGSVDEQVS